MQPTIFCKKVEDYLPWGSRSKLGKLPWRPRITQESHGFSRAELSIAMQLMLAAKSIGYDTVPMRGFDADRLIHTLHIPDRYIPIMMIPIGIASRTAHVTTRIPLVDIVVHESF
jgi:nitroreductase